MITKGDEYPIHQTADPVAYVGATRNFYDRFFFNGFNREGSVFFGGAMGVYPYVDILDGAFSVIVDGIEHCVYGSRIMHMERCDTQVGPIGVEIVTPLKSVRLTCDDPDNGIRADLLFNELTLPHEEPRFLRRNGSQIAMDSTRMTQFGTWQGWIEVKGRRIEVEPNDFWGCRDRSWGVRYVGAGDTQPNPSGTEYQFYWLWAPILFDDFATHYFVNEDSKGQPWNSNGIVIPYVGGPETPAIRQWSSNIKFRSGTRFAETASIDFVTATGEDWRIDFDLGFNFYMRGIGYVHPHWRHGTYHGELETGYEELILDEVEPTNIHIQALSKVTLTTPNGTHHGQGVLEQLMSGPHEPSGWKERLDMTP